MIVDSHQQIQTGAVFDPATFMRNKGNGNNGAAVTQQQQARQKYWSGMTLNRASSMQDATAGGSSAGNSGKPNSKAGPQQHWTTPMEKEIYTPFKAASGRVTPLDDPYCPPSRMGAPTPNNEYMPVPQDPRERPPSRAASIHSSMLMGGRKGEGSVVYQPLSPTNFASAWSNSLMFNKPFGMPFDPFEHPPDAPLTGPPLPHIQTLPRQLPLARNTMGPPPEEPMHNTRQQVPHGQMGAGGYPAGRANSDLGHIQKLDPAKPAPYVNRVTVVPNGEILGNSPSLSSVEVTGGEDNGGSEKQHNNDINKKKTKTRQRLSRQRQLIKPTKEDGRLKDQNGNEGVSNLPIVEKLAILHILLGLCLFAIGISRLLLLSVWGLGIELVFGVYVVLMGTMGVIGCRRRHYCSLAATFVMSSLSCVLAIPPFVTGLLVTIPDTFRASDPKLFTSPQEPYAVDILLSVICLLELIFAIITSAMGCAAIGRKWKGTERKNGALPVQQPMSSGMAANRMGVNQPPVFTTSVNITHPAMIK